jgi:hypothetical protein
LDIIRLAYVVQDQQRDYARQYDLHRHSPAPGSD